MDIETLASRLRDYEAEDARVEGEVVAAAVAAILCPSADASGFDALFIRRSEHAHDPWSGHMALPGGRLDSEDSDLEAAAVREVAEEVGIDLHGQGRLLGRLSQVASPPMTPRVVVTPYVWVLQETVALKLDPREVASAHWFGLGRLLCNEGRGSFEFRFRGADIPLPRVDLDGHRIWGMTLRVVDDLLDQVRTTD